MPRTRHTYIAENAWPPSYPDTTVGANWISVGPVRHGTGMDLTQGVDAPFYTYAGVSNAAKQEYGLEEGWVVVHHKKSSKKSRRQQRKWREL
jgi:hypothetical protein